MRTRNHCELLKYRLAEAHGIWGRSPASTHAQERARQRGGLWVQCARKEGGDTVAAPKRRACAWKRVRRIPS